MYRFPSAGTGSYFTVEGQNQSGWSLIESIPYNASTAKYYPSYTFTPDKGYTSIKFTYTKAVGNLALDDVTIEHGKVDTVAVLKDTPVTGNQYTVTGLTGNQQYFYRLRAVLGSSTSPYSGLIGVTTVSTGTAPVHHLSYKIGTSPAGIHIYDLKGTETIRLYSVAGSLLANRSALSGTLTLPVQTRGIFILQISDGRNTETYKIVR